MKYNKWETQDGLGISTSIITPQISNAVIGVIYDKAIAGIWAGSSLWVIMDMASLEYE
jgi:hypothetical protein